MWHMVLPCDLYVAVPTVAPVAAVDCRPPEPLRLLCALPLLLLPLLESAALGPCRALVMDAMPALNSCTGRRRVQKQDL